MKKTKINSQEATNAFAKKYGSNITVNPIKMIVESSNEKPVLEKKLFALGDDRSDNACRIVEEYSIKIKSYF